MEQNFTNIMANHSDEELVKITTSEREDYKPEAIKAAEEELELRYIEQARLKSIKKEVAASSGIEKKIESNLVSSWLRFIHFIVDFIAYTFVLFTISFIIDLFVPSNKESTLLTLLAFIVVLGTYLGYYVVMEYYYQKTLGKFFTKTMVISEGGTKPSFNDIFIRSACRLIPIDHFSYFFIRNGLHDRLSNTRVVKDGTDTGEQ